MWNLPPLIDLTGQSKCTSTIKASSARATLKMQYGWIYWKIVQALDPDDASMWRSRVRPLWAPTTSQDGRRWISKRNRNQQPRWPGDRRLRLWGRTSRLGRQSRKPRCPFSLDKKTKTKTKTKAKTNKMAKTQTKTNLNSTVGSPGAGGGLWEQQQSGVVGARFQREAWSREWVETCAAGVYMDDDGGDDGNNEYMMMVMTAIIINRY